MICGEFIAHLSCSVTIKKAGVNKLQFDAAYTDFVFKLKIRKTVFNYSLFPVLILKIFNWYDKQGPNTNKFCTDVLMFRKDISMQKMAFNKNSTLEKVL